MAKKDIKGIETTPFGGGTDIRHQNEPALIPSGGYSAMQNMRNMYPGLKKRPGCAKQHDAMDLDTGTNLITNGAAWTGATGATPPTGWTVTTAGVFTITDSSDGSPYDACLALTVNATPLASPRIYCSFTTVIGTSYRLSLAFKKGTAASGTWALGITATGATLGTGTLTAATWTAYTCDFIATATTTYLSLMTNSAVAGQTSLWDTATLYKANKVMSLFQFSKAEVAEKHFYAQMSDGDVLETTTAPPGVSTGAVFGTEVHSGTATGMKPASWAVTNDIMFYANGSDRHQCYAGAASKIGKFIVYVAAAAIPAYPTAGVDYTTELRDTSTTTVAVLDSLDTLANYDCIFIKTDTNAVGFDWTKSLSNSTAAVAQLKYWDGDSFELVAGFNDGTELLTLDTAPGTAWVAGNTITGVTSGHTALIVAVITSLTYQISTRTDAFHDGEVLTNGTYTADQGAGYPKVATLGYSGAMTWTKPAAKPRLMFDEYGYWWQLSLASGALGNEVEISNLTYKSAWQNVEAFSTNDTTEAVEVQKYTAVTTSYSVYSGDAVTLNAFAYNANYALTDKCYFCSADPIEAIYIDVATPATGSATLNKMYYWSGSGWVEYTFTDTTGGFHSSGWIYIGRKTQEETLLTDATGSIKGYWYLFTIGVENLSATCLIGIYTAPYVEGSDFGNSQHVNTWNERTMYVFDDYPSYVTVSPVGSPFTMIGDDFGIWEMGDGRNNKIVNSKTLSGKWYAWQEEKGIAGGCISYLSGTTIANITRTVLSDRLGTMNSKTVVVVDSVETGLRTDEVYSDVAFFLSRNGVFMTDGDNIKSVSDDIQNYFDQTDASCIRIGYESEHWLWYDSTYRVLRMGLVTGASATVPNTFLVYDIKAKGWMPDSLAQPFSCMTEVEAGSGTATVVQVAGGAADGTVYNTNTGTNDVSTAIDSFATVEFDLQGNKMAMSELVFRVKSQTAGDITLTPYVNGIARTALTFAQTAAIATDKHRRHRRQVNIVGDHISLKFQHNTASQDCYLLDYGASIDIYEDQ